MAVSAASSLDDIRIIEPLCAVFRRKLKSEGLKYTPERAQILDAIIRRDDNPGISGGGGGLSADAGALPTLYAATADIPSGSYVGPDGRGELRGHPGLVGMSAAAQDADAARRLWEASERLTGVTYAFA